MGRMNFLSARLGNKDTAIVDKQQDTLQVYKEDHNQPSIKLTSIIDIVAFRDLLNDAYPSEVYVSANGNKDQVQRRTV